LKKKKLAFALYRFRLGTSGTDESCALRFSNSRIVLAIFIFKKKLKNSTEIRLFEIFFYFTICVLFGELDGFELMLSDARLKRRRIDAHGQPGLSFGINIPESHSISNIYN
jgi:hypothetical protein